MKPTFSPYDAAAVAALRAGGPDAYGNPAERGVSDGGGHPCRACLCDIPAGAAMLIAAARPFAALHPYAETGPIFLCADPCTPWSGSGLPPILGNPKGYLVKAYGATERIVYGTGRIVPPAEIEPYAAALFERTDIAFVDVRSASNNCFMTRIIRPQ